MWLLKLNGNGDTLWTKSYVGASAHSIQLTSDSNFIITGAGPGAYGGDVWLLKTDTNGDSLWLRTFNHEYNDWGNEIRETSDGGYIIVGGNGLSGFGPDVYIVKADSNGDSLWARNIYGGLVDTVDAEAYSVQEVPDGGYIFVGHIEITGEYDRNLFIMKFSAAGDSLWTKTYGGIGWDVGYSIDKTSDGGFIIAGYTDSYGIGGAIYLVKINQNGDTLWTKTYGGSDYEGAESVRETADGGFIITGATASFGAGYLDIYLLKTNAQGDSLWATAFGGEEADCGYSVEETLDGGFIITGEKFTTGLGYDVYVVKTEPDLDIEEPKEKVQRLGQHIRPNIMPNPFKTSTFLRISGHQNIEGPELKIYDASGRLVKSIKLATNTYRLGADLVPGIYFFKLNGTAVGKVVKVR
jgi:hypothetical protein